MSGNPTEKHNRVDIAKTIELYHKGVSKSDIARHMGVTPQSIDNALKKALPTLDYQILRAYQKHTADILDNMCYKIILEIERRGLKQFPPSVLPTMYGILFDKARIAKGAPTETHLHLHTYDDIQNLKAQVIKSARKLNVKEIVDDAKTP